MALQVVQFRRIISRLSDETLGVRLIEVYLNDDIQRIQRVIFCGKFATENSGMLPLVQLSGFAEYQPSGRRDVVQVVGRAIGKSLENTCRRFVLGTVELFKTNMGSNDEGGHFVDKENDRD